MQIIGQLGIVLGFSVAGEVLSRLLPFTLPSSVIGILLMTACFRTGLLKEGQVEMTAAFLTANMSLFFLPATVNILQNYDRLRPVLWKVAIICTVGTVLTFLAAYGAVRAVQLMQQKRRRKP